MRRLGHRGQSDRAVHPAGCADLLHRTRREGGYTLCAYHTEWRQSTNVWSWPAESHPLAFPSGTNTCGQGNAVIYPGEPDDSWRIFFNGRYPAQADSFHLYVGTMTWPTNQPTV